MLTRHAAAVCGLTAIIVTLLSACDAVEPSPSPIPSSSQSSEPSQSATPTPRPESFSQPAKCAEILSADRLASFADQDLVLLGGPEGRYGNDYLLDPTPERQAGGITCIWGFSDTEISSVTISVAPVTAATRPGIMASLSDQGLNTSAASGSTVYWQQGDTEQQPAIVNVLTNDSWISVIETIGGDVFYNEAVDLTDEVHQQVFTPK
jgi:hypothetical protein